MVGHNIVLAMMLIRLINGVCHIMKMESRQIFQLIQVILLTELINKDWKLEDINKIIPRLMMVLLRQRDILTLSYLFLFVFATFLPM